jgi:hypothetical protein
MPKLSNSERELKVKATFYSGLVSGAIYKFILHPIDTIKSKIMVKNFKKIFVHNFQGQSI